MEHGVARMESGVARVDSGRAKRKMTLSEALKWAWGDELPKEPSGERPAGLSAANAWDAILRFGEAGTIVDRQPNRFGCIPFDMADFPHPDALAIAAAVASLADTIVEAPEGWHPMPDLAGLDAALARRALSDTLDRATRRTAGGDRVFRARADHLVVRHAILGLVPDWRVDHLPVKEYETWPNGRPRWFVLRETRTVIGEHADGSDRIEVTTTEVDGWSERRQRPVAGAYRKARFSPDPVPVMVARAEYEIFCAAMALLFDDLAGRLETVALVPEDWPVQPWDDSDVLAPALRRGKILPDLAAGAPPLPEPKKPAKSKARRKRGAARKRA